MEERNKGTLGDFFDLPYIASLMNSIFQILFALYFCQCAVLQILCGCLAELCSEPSRNPLLLDVAASENGRAHVITDGLVGAEQEMMPLLGFLAKSRREAEFPTEILMRLGERMGC